MASEAALREAKQAVRRMADEARRAGDLSAAELEALRSCLSSAQQRENGCSMRSVASLMLPLACEHLQPGTCCPTHSSCRVH